MVRWLKEAWDKFVLKPGEEPPSPFDFDALHLKVRRDADFRQHYMQEVPELPLPGDLVYLIRGGNVLAGHLLQYINDGVEVEVPGRGVLFARQVYTDYDLAFNTVVEDRARWNDAKPTKAPHLRLVEDE